jgi:hypothetical protein
MRANPMSLFHEALGSPVMDSNGEMLSWNANEVLGVMIHLPKQETLTSADGTACDPLPEPWEPTNVYQTVPYHLPRPVAHGSWIRYFLNGKDLGVAFENLYYGKYYPAVSVYKQARVEVKFTEVPADVTAMHMAKPMAQCVVKPEPSTEETTSMNTE